MAEIMKRAEVPVRDTWKMEDIFENDQAWEEAFAACDAACAEIEGYKGKLFERESLLHALQAETKAEILLGKVYSYAECSLNCDGESKRLQAMSARAQSLYVKFATAVSYIKPEIVAADGGYIDALSDDPEFADYSMLLRDLNRSRAHTLSAEMEKLVAMTGEMGAAPSNIYEMLNTLDMKFPPIKDENGDKAPVTHSGFIPLMMNGKKKVRRQAFESLYGTYKKFQNTVPAIYQASVKGDVFYARAARFDSSLEAKLFPDNVPKEVYYNLISAVHNHLPGLQKLVVANAKLSGVKKPSMIDVYLPPKLGFDVNLPFDEAYKLMTECLGVLGEDYTDVLKRAYSERWIDVYENEGKRSGAYSAGVYGVHPFVLMNYKSDLDHLLTSSHEMGHAMHSYLSEKHQPAPKSDYSLFVAEVASTVNEVLTIKALMKKHPEGEAFLLYTLLDGFRTTVFRQTMFAEFELKAHEMAESDMPLTAQTLNKLYADLNSSYYAPLKQDELIAYEWMRIPHFYRSFYVYKYATGFSAAMAIASKIYEEGEEMVRKYKSFLSAGGSVYPIEALKLAGVDMSTGEPVERALGEFEKLLARYLEITDA